MHTLILLPGLACDAGLWQAQLPVLAPHARVQVSDVHFRFDSLAGMADALLAEHAGPLVLAGASMGGMVAMHAALRAPQRVAGLALLGTSARADSPELIRLRTEACALFAAGRMDEVLRANVMFAFHPDQAADAGLIEGYLALIRRAGADALIRQNRAVMARPDLRPQLPGLRCRTLVAVGEADALTPPDCAQEIATAVRGAELVVVPGAGHMLTLEQPRAVAHLLLDWLSELPPAAGPMP
jgi:pimeloyl-ACP methyl ester carboxylesterase